MSPHVGHRYLDGSVEHTSQEPGILFQTYQSSAVRSSPIAPVEKTAKSMEAQWSALEQGKKQK